MVTPLKIVLTFCLDRPDRRAENSTAACFRFLILFLPHLMTQQPAGGYCESATYPTTLSAVILLQTLRRQCAGCSCLLGVCVYATHGVRNKTVRCVCPCSSAAVALRLEKSSDAVLRHAHTKIVISTQQ